MEIIIGLIVVAVVVYFIFKTKKVEEAAVPYKVETPVAEPTTVAEAPVADAPVAETPKARKPRVAKATTKPAVKAKTARKPKAK